MNRARAIAPWLFFAGIILSLLIIAHHPASDGLLLLQFTVRLLFALAIVSLLLAAIVALVFSTVIASTYRSSNAWFCFFREYCFGWLTSFTVSIAGFPTTLFFSDYLIYKNTTKDASRISLYFLFMLIWAIFITGGATLKGLREVQARYGR